MYYEKEIVEQLYNINTLSLFFTDVEEIYDNKNFHSEEQDELEIPDGKYFNNMYIHMFLKKDNVFIL